MDQYSSKHAKPSARQTKSLQGISKLALLTFSLLLGVGCAEWMLRAYLRWQHSQQLAGFTNDMVQATPGQDTQYQLIPNHSLSLIIAEGKPNQHRFSFRINKDGLRGPDLNPNNDEQRRVLTLGDSYTFGFAVGLQESYGAQLQTLLNAQLDANEPAKPVQVINAGIPGYNSEQELAFLPQLLQRYQPQLVILGYVMNDAECVVMVPLAPDYAYRDAWCWLWEEAKLGINSLTENSWFEVNKAQYNTKYLSSFKSGNPRGQRSRQALAQMSWLCKERGCDFLVAILPDFTQHFTQDYPYLSIHQQVKGWGSSDGYEVLDLWPAFAGKNNMELLIPGDGHPNPQAHQRFAQELQKKVAAILKKK